MVEILNIDTRLVSAYLYEGGDFLRNIPRLHIPQFIRVDSSDSRGGILPIAQNSRSGALIKNQITGVKA